MDSPNRIANISMGTVDTTGTGPSSPTSPPNQPHWNTATTAPWPAPMDSTFMAAAFTGTQTDRNTIICSSSDSAMMVAMNHGSRWAARSVRSMLLAVMPPTCASASVPASAVASVSSRSRWTRSSVSGFVEEVAGRG